MRAGALHGNIPATGIQLRRALDRSRANVTAAGPQDNIALHVSGEDVAAGGDGAQVAVNVLHGDVPARGFQACRGCRGGPRGTRPGGFRTADAPRGDVAAVGH